ncbi:MAG TPA: c-type cytochrome biogenesis protein CcmI [Hellea balneolensis]|uniref:C-type cytochrome biogenesis protein CcmI n=1 Tax=Hellea balneolensis TaxID=287478 RepID=A0A7V5U187_9PROT|nr:c-type cytochrome biogenesis protein CcmI [Hellea balneolensis]
MIWLIFAILVLASLLYLVQPLIRKDQAAPTSDSELANYAREIRELDENILKAEDENEKRALEQARLQLQRQILKREEQMDQSGPMQALANLVLVLGVPTALGLYLWLGRPELTKVQHSKQAEMQSSTDRQKRLEELPSLIAQLGRKLEREPYASDPKGWLLYAHGLMSLQRYDEALKAYEKALQLTQNDPEIKAEYEEAKAWIAKNSDGQPSAAAPGPNSEQMRAAQQMSPEQRQAMIENMVNGLSEKLRSNPKDIGGWVRLLNARRVLGQDRLANEEIARMKTVFENQPDTIRAILEKSGWVEQ